MEDFITEITQRLNNRNVQNSHSLNISEDGSTLIYGYPDEECVLIFTKQDDQWVFQAKLTASDAVGSDRFGISVSISSDGSTAIAGAHGKSSFTGAAYVFTRSGSTWTQQQKLTASDGAASDWFGYSVSLSADGNTALVGAYTADLSDKTDAGVAYVFTRSGSTWTQQQKLTAGDAATSDAFGRSVSISSDGSTAIVGAYRKSLFTGAAYVFSRSGSTWTQQAKLAASDGAACERFGYRCILSTDGTLAQVFNWYNNEYTFTLVDGVWTETTKSKGN